jgi:RNA polymerase sigma-70 factor (ECF subfamily)
MDRTLEIEKLLEEAGWLRRLAASLVGDGAQAEDLVQDTWLAALRRPPRPDREARPWLARVVRNLARNTRRGRSRREAREGRAHEERESPGPADLAQEAEAQRLLAEAVTRLAEPLRAVIVLRYFQGLDSTAAAERLGVPASTVRTRVQRALEELRADLDRRCEGGRRSWAALLVPLARSSEGALDPAAAGAALVGSWPAVAAGAAMGVLAVSGAALWSATRGAGESATAPAIARVGKVAGETTLETGTQSTTGERRPLEIAAETGSPSGSTATRPDQAADLPGSAAAEVSGTVLVDGRPPEWPLWLSLEPKLPKAKEPAATLAPAKADFVKKRVAPRELLLEPEQRGAFRFEGLAPDWKGRLCVGDYSLADGGYSLEIDAPISGLVVHLRSGPEIVGRLRGPDGLPIPGLPGSYQLRTGLAGESWNESDEKGFVCRADGRFRIPSKTSGDWGELTLVVEAQDHGYLRHESPAFVPAEGLDLGELVLEPLRALEFTVRDPQGNPIAGAFARVDGPSWRKRGPLTGADGSGVLELFPDRAADVRFSAFGYAERVLRIEPGSRPEVVLEPLAVLAIHLGEPSAVRVRLSAESAAFVWDSSGWGEGAESQIQLGRTKLAARRTPSESGQPFEYELGVPPDGRLELAGLTPDLALTLESLDGDGRSLSVATASVGSGQRMELELGAGGTAEGSTRNASLPQKRKALSRTK